MTVRQQKCQVCNGTGQLPYTVTYSMTTYPFTQEQKNTCWNCNGTGFVWDWNFEEDNKKHKELEEKLESLQTNFKELDEKTAQSMLKCVEILEAYEKELKSLAEKVLTMGTMMKEKKIDDDGDIKVFVNGKEEEWNSITWGNEEDNTFILKLKDRILRPGDAINIQI